ncbi:hypothetical protein RHGRI_031143 [Rhododendron griersonianum]|uniref:PWWP domain-containing protein n=1 Tax=Rhododendron griersonianum TaxID=479676 RepID=A0AAV6IBE7_9ERIC|nr:hypothetical protein RHGRI_031143 [Rhododendron griersonianum]
MGLSVVDCRAGTLVWVQRKNGTWWPGRVVEISELSPSLPTNRTATTPIKLLGREDSSVDWYNVEKSKRIKAFRCGEFDDCITKAESSQVSSPKKIGKNACREVAILDALELEKQEVQKKHQAAGKERAGIICQGKRSRRVYLPAESDNCWKKTAICPKVLKVSSSTFEVHECPKQSGSAEVNISSRAMESEPSENDSRGPDRVQRDTQLSGKFGLQPGNINGTGNHEVKRLSCGVQKRELKGKENIGNLTRRHGDVIDIKSVKLKKEMANKLCQSPHSRSYLEEPGFQFADTVHSQFYNMMQMTLTDVELKIQASYRREHVPLVSLMSRLNGKSIIGHLVDVEASDEGSLEILLGRNHETSRKFSNNGSATIQPAWRTSRRTPVCYVPQDDQNPGNLGLKARERRLPPKKFLLKALKKPRLSNQKSRTLSSFDSEQGKDSMAMANRVTCVPVKHIFSKLLVAVGSV